MSSHPSSLSFHLPLPRRPLSRVGPMLIAVWAAATIAFVVAVW